MAKWGEGDPRWIVEERPDATNVNNWHWTEKNADSWSKRKLEDLFTNLIIEAPAVGMVCIEKVDKCEGEARANNRKAKLIFFYEWEISLCWKGHLNGNNTEVEGSVHIPNLSEEHEDINDVDIDVTVKDKGPEADVLKEMMRKGEGAKRIRQQLQAYVTALKNEYVSGLILPAKDAVTVSTPNVTSTITKSAPLKLNKGSCSAYQQMKNLDLGCEIKMTTLESEETFKCTGQELYSVLTQREMMRIFTGGEVKLKETKKGENFEMIGGNVQGQFVELVPYTRIALKWRLKSWPSGHFSDVVLDIKQNKEDTKLSVKQTNVPEKEFENTKIGWSRYYWDAIKQTFGFGSSLF